MTTAILIEGRNFYVGWKKTAADRDIDVAAMIKWLADGDLDVHATYYAGTDDEGKLDANARARSDEMLDLMEDAGVAVKTFPLKVKHHACDTCNTEYQTVMERQLDCAMAIDAIRAIDNGADRLIIVSNDVDVIPILTEAKRCGTSCTVASWRISQLAPALERAANNVMWMAPDSPFMIAADYAEESSAMLSELDKAERKFSGGYVGLHFFLKKWQSEWMTPSIERRSEILNKLVASGDIQLYSAGDGNKAVKRRRPQDVAPPATPERSESNV